MKRIKMAAMFACLAAVLACGLLACSPAKSTTPMVEASITRTFIVDTYDGTMLVVDLDVKNNSEMSMPAGMVGLTYAKASQNGQQLSSGFLSDDVPGALASGGDAIAPGGSGKNQAVFVLSQQDGTVDFKIEAETTDYSNVVEVVSQSIDLASVEKVQSEPEFDVTVDDVLVTDDGEGKNLLVLEMTFTNNSDSAASFGSLVRPALFQNGVELKSGYLPYNHPAYDNERSSNTYTDVKQGASLAVQVAFELVDAETPVEMELIDAASFDQRVFLDKTIEVGTSTPAPEASA
ncbi:DUF5067 domain-containing protein [Gordonibacter sp. An230]|uniref:DUF5067 domain-containing protein n=1 Tax=Gordonibacter sp. An230 TaxID=1965592 RepID=UPI0013A63A79|nr:DUF5067 domain-containing protein [Gordonibacter sp. An230]